VEKRGSRKSEYFRRDARKFMYFLDKKRITVRSEWLSHWRRGAGWGGDSYKGAFAYSSLKPDSFCGFLFESFLVKS
jgi:hypothetical protein